MMLYVIVRSRRRSRFSLLRLCLGLRRPGVLPLRRDVAIDKFDDRDGRGIAVAEAGLEHPRIAAVTVLVTGSQHLEQLLHHADIAHLRDRLTARVKIAALGKRDKLLDDRTQ